MRQVIMSWVDGLILVEYCEKLRTVSREQYTPDKAEDAFKAAQKWMNKSE